MKAVLVICLLLGAASAKFNVKMNTLMDFQIKVIDQLLKSHKLTRINLRDEIRPDMKATGNYLEDVSTMTRVGDAVMEAVDDSTLKVSLQYGLSSMTFGVSNFWNKDVNFTNGKYVIEDNALAVEYTTSFTEDGRCSMSLDRFEITVLDKVTLFSDNPHINNIDVSKYFGPVKDQVNEFFKSDDFINKIKQYNPCSSDTSKLTDFFVKHL